MRIESMKRGRFQFKVMTLLAIMVPVAVGSLWLRNYLDDSPIDWQPYSELQFDKDLSDGKKIVVLIGAEWNATFAFNKLSIETAKIRRLLRSTKYRTLYLNTTNHTATYPLRDRLGYDCSLAVFDSSNPDNPKKLEGMLTEEAVIEAIVGK